MKFIKKMMAPKEVRVSLNTVKEVSQELNCEALKVIQGQLEEAILNDPEEVKAAYKKRMTPREQVYLAIVNLSGYHLESGRYHKHKGILNSQGYDFLALFDRTIDKLQLIDAVDFEEAKAQKRDIREIIKKVGEPS